MNLTDSEEARLLDLSVQGARLALLTSVGGETEPGVEISGSSYVRMAIPFAAANPATGTVRNSAPVTFMDLPQAVLTGWELWVDSDRRWYGHWFTQEGVWTSDGIAMVGHGLVDTDPIIFLPGGVPTPLAANATYYVVDATTDSFKVSLAPGDTAAPLTGSGVVMIGKAIAVQAGDSLEIETGQLTLALD